MPTPKKRGCRRLEIVGVTAEWVDQVKDVAEVVGLKSVSAYARVAINERLRRDGHIPVADTEPETFRPGRPKGAKNKGKGK